MRDLPASAAMASEALALAALVAER
jgi:hypothetical protein